MEGFGGWWALTCNLTTSWDEGINPRKNNRERLEEIVDRFSLNITSLKATILQANVFLFVAYREKRIPL